MLHNIMLIGIVGKPSAGKSTFLNAACLTDVKTANYPFTTIEPNLGTSYIRIPCVCKEFNVIDNPKNSLCVSGVRYIPIKLLDVAGLVPDAHEGKGMGNKFLSDLARADVLIHVVDCSGSLDAEGQDIDEGTRDPMEDILFLEKEINFWFKDIILRKDWSKFIRKIEQEKLNFTELLQNRMSGLIHKEDIIKAIEQTPLDFDHLTSWTDDDILIFATKLREISKPIIIAANKIDKNPSKKIFESIKARYSGKVIPCSALAEYWLKEFHEKGIVDYNPGDSNFKILKKDSLTEKEQKILDNLQEKILDIFGSTGIQDLLNYVVFQVLNQIVVFPVYDIHNLADKDGNVLPDAHLITKGMKLKNFVQEKIHSDLAKNFIYGIDARTKLRLGESYELKNRDVVRIVSAVKPK
ncbi:MAG: redox-regulated ATPase YchF [Promethearchaeota archaeon]